MWECQLLVRMYLFKNAHTIITQRCINCIKAFDCRKKMVVSNSGKKVWVQGGNNGAS